MRTRFAAAAAFIVLAPLGACSTIKEAVRGPDLAPVGYPAALAPLDQKIIAQANAPQPATANSLWRTGARTFFNDQRAAKVGDILTVLININDSAKTTNETTAGRTSTMTAGIPHLLGLESTLGKILPSGYDPANAISTNSKSTNDGVGAVSRQDQISLTIAAVVSSVLPNGNLVIQGTQEVKTNTEVRQLTIAGIVRPEDISAANTILHTQIAEARINYGGRGDISSVQKTPAGQSLLQRFSPF
ncbi:MAG TPA: flagellar basal body L-ring protein FlgH [Phenylobacterium sp.]|jgi:flagellar L-ring protein precursor FlgH|uniref:flagellar basal body L-ring protein FlgH n=1 Tax=Phenylobacterium sp. TaxID=1871053 RepID=UPI002C71DE99|nr:flagellar basal body L-ring protein FlgH [Phenylobacterium sp.]HXA39222.1 flagellar basal body L-ring protein FlgH [Phenylobacterium sp.]